MELFPKVKVTGRCLDQISGRPVAGIQLGLVSHGAGQILYYGHSDADGRYEIEAPAGPVTVEALSGADRQESRTVEADTAKTTQMPDLKLKLLPMVRGQVVGTDGKPVSGAFVMYAWHPTRRTSVLADKEGRFEFRMHEDDFGATITALHPTDRRAGGGVISREDLKAGKEMQITVYPESEIRGTVVDSGGMPRAGVKVWLIAKTEAAGWGIYGGQASTVTDAEGKYRFPALGRNPKQYRISLSESWDDAAAPRSKWVTADQETIVIDPLTATEKYLKVKAELPSLAAAPEIRCRQWLNSQPIKLESLRGKVVLLAFDATWSKQTADDLAEIQLAHQLYADKGLVVIGVHHHGERIEDVAAFAVKKKLTYPIGIDNADGETFDRYGVNYYPRCVLIGRDGKKFPVGWDDGNFLAAVRKAVLGGR
jgi:peroxiredoxin